MSEVWRCNCPICRLFVHPILKRLAPLGGSRGRGKKKSVAELAKGRPVEVVKLSEQPPEAQEVRTQEQAPAPATPPPPTPTNVPQQAPPAGPTAPATAPAQAAPQQQGGEERKEEKEEEKPKQVVEVSVPREVLERIEILEGEVEKIKKYVKTSVDGIKATLVDLRSAMAELSNPFNILRKYADIFLSEESGGEGEERKRSSGGNGQAQTPMPQYPQVIPVIVPIQQPLQTVQQPSASGTNHGVAELTSNSGKASSNAGVSNSEGSEVLNGSKVSGNSEQRGKVKLSPDLYERLAQWVNSMLEKVPLEKFRELIDNYVAVGVLDEEMGEVLKRIADTVNDLKASGLSLEEQAKSLKQLLETLGLTKEEVEKGVLKAVERAKKEVEGSGEGGEEGGGAEELLGLITGGGE